MGQKVKKSLQDFVILYDKIFYLILRKIFLLRISWQDKLSCVKWVEKICLILRNIVLKQDFIFCSVRDFKIYDWKTK